MTRGKEETLESGQSMETRIRYRPTSPVCVIDVDAVRAFATDMLYAT